MRFFSFVILCIIALIVIFVAYCLICVIFGEKRYVAPIEDILIKMHYANEVHYNENGSYTADLTGIYEYVGTRVFNDSEYHEFNVAYKRITPDLYEIYANPANTQTRPMSFYLNNDGIVKFTENKKEIQYSSGGRNWKPVR
jgi:flagellar basal body-associated protein FliL